MKHFTKIIRDSEKKIIKLLTECYHHYKIILIEKVITGISDLDGNELKRI